MSLDGLGKLLSGTAWEQGGYYTWQSESMERLRARWRALKAWAAGDPPPPSSPSELFAYAKKLREKARAQGWESQLRAWEAFDSDWERGVADADALSERGLDLGVAEKRAGDAGYRLSPEEKAADALVTPIEQRPEYRAAKAVDEGLTSAVSLPFRAVAELGKDAVRAALPPSDPPATRIVKVGVAILAVAGAVAWGYTKGASSR